LGQVNNSLGIGNPFHARTTLQNYCILNIFTAYIATPFWTEGIQRRAKAVTQVRKPGGLGKIERLLFCLICQSIRLAFMLYWFKKNFPLL